MKELFIKMKNIELFVFAPFDYVGKTKVTDEHFAFCYIIFNVRLTHLILRGDHFHFRIFGVVFHIFTVLVPRGQARGRKQRLLIFRVSVYAALPTKVGLLGRRQFI